MPPLAYFNSKPVRPEYVDKVLRKLKMGDLTMGDLVKKTRMTRTQVACTLDKLLFDKTIESFESERKKYFRLIDGN